MNNPEAKHAPAVGVYWNSLEEQPDQLRRIAAATGQEPVVVMPREPVPDVEILMVGAPPPDTVPRETPRLRMVQTASAGIEWLRDHPLWDSDVALATSSGVHGVQIGEHVLMLLLALRRHLPEYMAAQRRHDWRHDAVGDRGISLQPGELYGLTLGLVGYGHIGRSVAHLARAFGMRVLAMTSSGRAVTDLTIPDAAPFANAPGVPAPALAPDQFIPQEQLDRLLAQSDAVIVCAPLTEKTAGLLDDERLGQMKPGAYLVNIARGKIVVEDALIRALREGRLAGAGLDVTAEEPLPVDSPLWEMSNVIVTPHISGSSERYVERAVNILLANIERLRRGEAPLTAVDRVRGY